MSQAAILLPTTGVINGLAEQNYINAALDTLNTKWAGASAPSGTGITLETGQDWLNTNVSTALVQNIYDGTNWLSKGVIDTTNHIWTPPIGGGAIPTIASASTVDLGSKPQGRKYVSGTTTITSFGTSAVVGTLHSVKFTGALTITASSGIVTQSSSNMSISANDETLWSYESSGVWKCLYWSASSSLPSFANNRIMANVSGSSASPSATTLSQVLDIGGATNGNVPFRAAGAWTNVSVSSILDTAVGSTVGGLAARGTSAWQQVAPVNAGYVLTDNGVGNAPTFQASAAGGYGGSTTSSNSSNLVLTSSSNKYQSVAMTADGLLVQMPDATTISTTGSPVFLITNDGTLAFGIVDNSLNLIVPLQAGESCFISLLANGTSAGTWSFQVEKSLVGGLLANAFAQINTTVVETSITPDATYGIGAIGLCCMGSNTWFMSFTNKPSQPSGGVMYGIAFTYNISTRAISAGTPVSLSTLAYSGYAIPLCYKITSTTALIIYQTNNATKGQVVTLTGTSVAAGTETALGAFIIPGSATNPPFWYTVSAGTNYFLAWNNSAIKGVGITISGTTVSAGTVQTGGTPAYWNGIANTTDPYGGFYCTQISSGTFAFAFLNATTATVATPNCQLATCSGTTVAFGSANAGAGGIASPHLTSNVLCPAYAFLPSGLSGSIFVLFGASQVQGNGFGLAYYSYSGTTLTYTGYFTASALYSPAYIGVAPLTTSINAYRRSYFWNSTTQLFIYTPTGKWVINFSGATVGTYGFRTINFTAYEQQASFSYFLLNQSVSYTSSGLYPATNSGMMDTSGSGFWLMPSYNYSTHTIGDPAVMEMRILT